MNLNQYMLTTKEKNNFNSLYNAAEQAYDQKKYDEALALIDQAKAQSTQNEDLAILEAYVYLAKAGPDTLKFVRV